MNHESTHAAGATADGVPGQDATTPRVLQPASIHRQLLVAFSHSNRAMRTRARAIGLKPGQPKVLEHLAAHEGCTQQEIAHACVMDKSTVASLLNRMEEARLVVRRTKADDRRGMAVFLTEEGRAAAERVLACRDEVDAIAATGLSEREQELLQELLARVIANLDRDEQEE